MAPTSDFIADDFIEDYFFTEHEDGEPTVGRVSIMAVDREERIFAVPAEQRIFPVEHEQRIFAVPREV